MLGKLNLLKASWSFTSLTAKVAVIAVATTIGLANVVGSAGASLDAVAFNTTAQSINTGTLSITLSAGSSSGSSALFGTTPSAGFDSYVPKMRPQDSFSHFVNLVTGPDMGISSPKLMITAGSGSAAILTSGSNALRVWVQGCSVAWSAGGTCSTTAVDLVGTTGSPVVISSLSTATAFTGSLALTAGATNYIKYTLSLPDKTETTTNGSVPSGTIQGKTASLTWTFSANQSAVTADSNT